MKIAFASDHGGFTLKETLRQYAAELGNETVDFGCFSAESVDFPDFAFPAAESVASGACDRAVLVCTTGIGMCICANKVKGIRCGLVSDEKTAEMTRRHNDTNALALGAHLVSEQLAKEIVRIWLTTPAEGGRHARRVGKIAEYEK